MPFVKKTVMHVHTGIEIGVRLIVAYVTPEQLSPSLFDALPASQREPLALGAASRAILTGSMRVHFHGDGAFHKGFLFRQSIDLPS